MIDVRIKVEREVKRITRSLRRHPKELDKALTRALNKCAARVRTRAVRELAKETGLKQKRIRSDVKIYRAGKTNFSAQVKFTGKHLNLINFQARQTKKGVTHKAWNNRRLIEGAFIATANSGTAVFMRYRKSRLPIEALWGPAIPREAADPVVRKAMDETVAEHLPPLLKHEVERAQQRLGAS